MTTKLNYRIAPGGLMFFNPADGEPGRFQGRVTLQTAGILEDAPSASIEQQAVDAIRQKTCFTNYSRIVKTLEGKVEALKKCEGDLSNAESLYSAAVLSGVDADAIAFREKQSHESRSEFERLQREYETLRHGAEEARGVLENSLQQEVAKHRETTATDAFGKVRAAKEKIAAAIAELLPELVAAESMRSAAIRQNVNVASAIPAIPEFTSTKEPEAVAV